MLRALSNTSAEMQYADHWVMDFVVLDDNGYLVSDPSITVSISDPAGGNGSPTPELLANGVYRVTRLVDLAGRYVTTVTVTDHGVLNFSAYVQTISPTSAMPDVDDVKAYLGTDGYSVDDSQLQDALDAEAAAQRAVCNVAGIYPADLRQALLRRVARNLALRGLPEAVFQGDAETGSLVLPGRDPEVRRLEAGHRKLVQP